MSTMNALLRRAIDSGANPSGESEQTIFAPIGFMTDGAVAPERQDLSYVNDNYPRIPVASFDSSVIETLHGNFPMPPSWDGGDFAVQFVWASPSSGSVVWRFSTFSTPIVDEGRWGNAFNVTVDSVDAALDNGVLYINYGAWSQVALGTPAAGTKRFLAFSVQRRATDGADTHSGDAHLIGVNIRYRASSLSDKEA
ncbi:hypothetical protein L0F51_03865 [Afifella sp. H1R]|uniref:hypothetical protein n=1 Tax=Afifella sp. H1R TaxID=2908841 RepID=UPI001F1CD939|nr:hypothetical protein [Afifella sp. H1R]MCF1502902.1 hypothetical protein [Afifella sp. H1R]